MHFEELEKTRKLIQQTTMLSAVEKAEWLQLLPDMSDKQIVDLVKILTPKAAPQPAPAPVSHAPAMPHVDITQKEIEAPHAQPKPVDIPKVAPAPKPIPKPVSPPMPKPTPVPTPPPAPKPAPAPTPIARKDAPVDPAELQSRVESIVRGLNHAPEQVSTAPVFKPMLRNIPEHLEMVALEAPEDFEKLQPAHLRSAELSESFEKILKAIQKVGKKYGIYRVFESLKKSELHKIYISMGTALLNDPNPDRDAAYEKVVTMQKVENNQWLTREELDGFIDFRRKLDTLV